MLNAIIGDEYIEDVEKQKELIEPFILSSIEDAEAEIDGYLNKRYNLPFDKVPKVISKFAKDIAAYNVVSRIGIAKDSLENIYLIRYQAAIQFLIKVSTGTIELGISNTQQAAQEGFLIKSNKRLFSRSSMKGW